MIPNEAVEAGGGLEYFQNALRLTSHLDGAEVIRGFVAGLKEGVCGE